jgi:hypothetical protein
MFGKKKAGLATQEPEQFPYGYKFKFKFDGFDDETFSDCESAVFQWWLWKGAAVVESGRGRVFLDRDVKKQVRDFGIREAKEHKTKWAQRARFQYTLGETYVLE